jgi:WD40 repeat protein
MRSIHFKILLFVVFLSNPALAFYEYHCIPHAIASGDLVDVDWHPSGDYALIGVNDGKILKVDASDWTVSQVAKPDDFFLNKLAFNPDGTEALIVGCYGYCALGEGRIYRWDDSAGTVSLLDIGSLPAARAVEFAPDGSYAVVVTWIEEITDGILTVWAFDSSLQGFGPPAIGRFGCPCDVSWRPDGQEALITTCCSSSVQVIAYRPDAQSSDRLVDTGYNGFGAASVDHHPLEGFGVVVDQSQNVYRWDGTWESVDLGSGWFYGIAFNSDGSRALLVSYASAPQGNLVGTVFEFLGDQGGFSGSEFRDVSIPDFDSDPWMGDTSTKLAAVAFRPGHCEGLIVGGNVGGEPKIIARFIDTRGADCLAPGPDGGDADGGNDDGGIEDGGELEKDGGEYTETREGDPGDTTDSPTAECSSDEDCPDGHACDNEGKCVEAKKPGGGCGCDSGAKHPLAVQVVYLLLLAIVIYRKTNNLTE